MQQMLKNRDVMEKSKKNVHFLAGSRQSKNIQITIKIDVIRLGRIKVVRYITQSRVSLFVMICQHFFSLSVELIFMTINKKTLRMSEGMQVNMMFFNTKFSKLKYFPGARASIQTNLVIKMIQKLAATLKDILPIILIVQRTLSYLSIYPRTQEAEQKIQLMSRMAKTCIIGVDS